jgi:hypothetical protein
MEQCDHCREPVHRDVNGWWVGEDGTADCSASDRGHEVGGKPR